MARVIVRYSFEGEGQKRVRGNLRKGLVKAGFVRIGTGTFEATDIALADAVDAVKEALDVVGTGALDSLLVYVDEPRKFAD